MAWEAKEMPSFHSSAKHKHYKPIKHHPWDKQQHTADAKKKRIATGAREGRTDGKSFKSFQSLARTQALYHMHTMAYTKEPVKKSGEEEEEEEEAPQTEGRAPPPRPSVRRSAAVRNQETDYQSNPSETE